MEKFLHICDETSNGQYKEVLVDLKLNWAFDLDEKGNPLDGGFPIYKECCKFYKLQDFRAKFPIIIVPEDLLEEDLYTGITYPNG